MIVIMLTNDVNIDVVCHIKQSCCEIYVGDDKRRVPLHDPKGGFMLHAPISIGTPERFNAPLDAASL